MSDSTPAKQGLAARLAPWVTAAVLGIVAVAIALYLPHVRQVSNDAKAGAADQAKQLPAGVQRAVATGATEAANLLTFSRAHFPADFSRALAGTTGDLRKDITGERAKTIARMKSQQIDLKATVEQAAFESQEADGNVLVLVTVNGFTTNDKGAASVATPQRLELTMTRSGSKWLAGNLTMVGIQ